MSSWDYGQAEQVEEEYSAAMKKGFCPDCAAHKPAPGNKICDPCIRDKEKAREDMDRYN